MTLRDPAWPLPQIPEAPWRAAFEAVRQHYLAQLLNPAATGDEVADWRLRVLQLNEIEHELKKKLIYFFQQ